MIKDYEADAFFCQDWSYEIKLSVSCLF